MSLFNFKKKQRSVAQPKLRDFSNDAFWRVLDNLDFSALEDAERELNRRVAPKSFLPAVKSVIYNNPATIVMWDDGTKTVVKCRGGDTYSPHIGLAMCVTKKAMGNRKGYDSLFANWLPESE